MPPIDLEQHENPMIVADLVAREISDGLRSERLSLYSGFLLNQDVLRLRRLAYRQPAWNARLSISGVLALYMQRLLSLAIDEPRVAEIVGDWLVHDLPLLAEHRPHFVIGALGNTPDAAPTEQELTLLSGIRSKYSTLSDNDGPYHTEVFPYDYVAPENVLLGRDKTSVVKAPVEADVEELMLEISERF